MALLLITSSITLASDGQIWVKNRMLIETQIKDVTFYLTRNKNDRYDLGFNWKMKAFAPWNINAHPVITINGKRISGDVSVPDIDTQSNTQDVSWLFSDGDIIPAAYNELLEGKPLIITFEDKTSWTINAGNFRSISEEIEHHKSDKIAITDIFTQGRYSLGIAETDDGITMGLACKGCGGNNSWHVIESNEYIISSDVQRVAASVPNAYVYHIDNGTSCPAGSYMLVDLAKGQVTSIEPNRNRSSGECSDIDTQLTLTPNTWRFDAEGTVSSGKY